MPRPDRTMKADDLFEKGTKQVFSVRTGIFIGYQREGQGLPEETAEQQEIKEIEDENQIKLEF